MLDSSAPLCQPADGGPEYEPEERPGSRRLERVLVYRGLPSAEHEPKPYARNLAQKTERERDPRVKVTLRPLKYRYERTADGRKATDTSGRPRPIIIERLEKGVDVLCALP
jgi:hypothetical protein